jgi:glycosyltransferase involved in cell wall biosynthesis
MAATSRVVRSYAIARPFVRRLYSRFVALQRDGIANCRLVEYALPGLLPHADAILEDIGVSPRRRVCFMLTESRSPASAERPRDGRFRIFSATRLQWRPPSGNLNLSPLDNKGTDTMLEGLRRFVASAPGRPVEIHLLRVGVDADAAVQHIERLGLAPFVRWHAELPQAEFLDEMARADVVLENFNAGSALGMAARDALALGKPVVAWGNSALFAKALGEPLPIFEALTSDQICSRLIEIVSDPGAVAANADCARAYVAKWFSPRSAAEQCLAVFSGRG